MVNSLRENAGRLLHLETAFGQLTARKKSLEEVEKKLKIAEEGNLREVVATQSKLASEKAVRESVEAIATEYTNGWNFSKIQRNFDQILATAGTCTDDAASLSALARIKETLSRNNAVIKQKELELNSTLKASAAELLKLTAELKLNHQRISGEMAQKLADLKARGIATDIRGLEALLRDKTSLAREIASVEQRAHERKQCQEQRAQLREQLKEVRATMTARRKSQLKGINSNLGLTIRDYTVFVRYDDAGITTAFVAFMKEKMHGTYFPDNSNEALCSRVTPSELADLILERSVDKIAEIGQISTEWASRIVDKLCYWSIIFDLQPLAKQPKPIVVVRTKSSPPEGDPRPPAF